MTLAISHTEGTRIILDKLVTVAPPFDPEQVVIRFCETLGAYGLNRVTGDRFGAEWVSSAHKKHGVVYQPSELTASEIYVEAGPLFSQGLIELLDIPSLRVELSLLERRPRPGGRGDMVDHPRNAHDDQAIAAIGSLLLAANQSNATRSDRSNDGITKALRDHDPYAMPVSIRPAPRHLPPGFAGGAYEPDFSRSIRDYDPII